MRAIQVEKFGGPEVLQLREVPDPVTTDGLISVEVDAAGINYADTHQAENSYHAPAKLPLIPGAEVVGKTPEGERIGIIGSAPYAVTKHAAIAFAEWLAVTYGDRGVRVSCLCPMGVRTKLLEDGLASPGEVSLGLRIATAAGKLLDPAEVAEAVLAGVAEERFLILPHPQVQALLQGKVADPDAWLAGMQAARTSPAAA